MGVRGLQGYLEKNCGDDGFMEVDLQKIAHEYRARTGRAPEMIVDLASCLRYIYEKCNTSYLCGGQLKEFVDLFMTLLIRIKRIGVKCIFFLDGSPPVDRLPIWLKRRWQEYENTKKVFSAIEQHGADYAEKLASELLRPASIWLMLNAALRGNNYKVTQTVQEADDDIMEYISRNGCFAVLAQDSDFAICEGITNYLSIQHFDVQTMRTRRYSGRALARKFSLHYETLPLFATLIGNDAIEQELLTNFHSRLMGWQKQRKWVPRHLLLPKLARWIRQHVPPGTDVERMARIASNAIGRPDLLDVCLKSLESYKLPKNAAAKGQRTIPNTTLLSEEGTKQAQWQKIVHVVSNMFRNKQLYSQIHSVVTRSSFFGRIHTTFYTNQHLSSSPVALRFLRQRFYGILLKEHPGGLEAAKVNEYLFYGPNEPFPSTIDAIFPDKSVDHPGLLKLWSTNSVPVKVKWRLLCWAIGNTDLVESVMDLPEPLKVPALALYYLVNVAKIKIEAWQALALLAQAVYLLTATISDLRAIRVSFRDTVPDRHSVAVAVHLGNVYASTCEFIHFLASACGEPTALHKYYDVPFFDGKLFHKTYAAMDAGESGEKLCGGRPENLVIYRKIEKLIRPISMAF